MLVWLALIALIIYLDQLTKWLILTYLPEGGLPVLNGVLRLTYVENTGAAFGMLSDKRWVFIIVSSAALLGMLWYMAVKKPKNKLLASALALIIGGGIGNMIDRVLLGYVIDFIDFCAFPNLWVWVFNVADASICVGSGLLMIYLIISTIKEAKSAKTAKPEKSVADTSAKNDKAASPQEAGKGGQDEKIVKG